MGGVIDGGRIFHSPAAGKHRAALAAFDVDLRAMRANLPRMRELAFPCSEHLTCSPTERRRRAVEYV